MSDVAEIGRHLHTVKGIVGYGNFLPWIDREFGWSADTAENFINVHKFVDGLSNSESIRNLVLTLPVSSVYALSAPSTPPEACTEILARAEAGEVLSVAEVKDVIKNRKQPARKPAQKEVAEPRLNAIGRPYSESFDPNYRVRISPPSIARLFAPQKFPGFGDALFGDARRKSPCIVDVVVPGIVRSQTASPVPGPEIDLGERAAAVLDESNAQQAEIFTPPAKVAVEVDTAAIAEAATSTGNGVDPETSAEQRKAAMDELAETAPAAAEATKPSVTEAITPVTAPGGNDVDAEDEPVFPLGSAKAAAKAKEVVLYYLDRLIDVATKHPGWIDADLLSEQLQIKALTFDKLARSARSRAKQASGGGK